MYSPRQIFKGLRWTLESPNLFFREVNRIYYSNRYGKNYYKPGNEVLKEDWDTLIILDACRYDMFRKQNTLPGELEARISRGSHTSQFLHGNFDGQTLHDTVYTTASPQLERRRHEIDVDFHKVNNVWSTDQWDDDEGTVQPEAMTKIGLDAHDRYPNKRHIIHYMQPHYPFIGSDIDNEARGFNEKEGFDIWDECMRGQIDTTTADLWSAYRRNLELVLDEVEKLYQGIEGMIVVTSDHGNMLGERASPIPIREWGHPYRVYTDELIRVPWLQSQNGERRNIISESPQQELAEIDEGVAEKRLKDLGYI